MLDIIISFAFIAYAISTGFYTQKKASKSLEDYFLAGRSIRGWQAGFSMAATQFAADTPLLVTGLIATSGIFMLWRLWIYGIAFLMMGFIFAANWRRAGVLTDAELTEIRYSGKPVLFLRALKAIYYGAIINCVVMAMVLVAAMRIAEVFLPWHQWLPGGLYNIFLSITAGLHLSIGQSVTGLSPSICTTNNFISITAILGFTALYATTGGMHSVIKTDVMQLIVAMVGTLVYAVIIVQKVGGLNGLTAKVAAIYGTVSATKMLSFSPTIGDALLPFLMIISLQWVFQMSSDGTGYMAQRYMSCQTDNEARIASLVFTWIQIFIRSLLWLVIAVGLLIIYPGNPGQMSGEHYIAFREMTFISGINDLCPPGIRGLILIGLLAALTSTLDSHLNWGASYFSNDIYHRLVCKHWFKREPKNRELVIVARLSNILILAIALIITTKLGSIQKAWFISLLFGAGMGSVLVLRWLWERINLYSELAAIVTSLVVAPILLIVTDVEWIRLTAIAVISTLAAIGVTFFTPSNTDEVLARFYSTVRPFGFWRKAAVLNGEDPDQPVRELKKGLKKTLLSALSLFLMLVGVGKLLIPSPNQSPVMPIIYIFIAASLTPFWLRKSHKEADKKSLFDDRKSLFKVQYLDDKKSLFQMQYLQTQEFEIRNEQENQKVNNK